MLARRSEPWFYLGEESSSWLLKFAWLVFIYMNAGLFALLRMTVWEYCA